MIRKVCYFFLSKWDIRCWNIVNSILWFTVRARINCLIVCLLRRVCKLRRQIYQSHSFNKEFLLGRLNNIILLWHRMLIFLFSLIFADLSGASSIMMQESSTKLLEILNVLIVFSDFISKANWFHYY